MREPYNADALMHLPKERRDWLEIYGNTWQATKVMPGTCEACLWGEGEHTASCVAAGERLDALWQAKQAEVKVMTVAEAWASQKRSRYGV